MLRRRFLASGLASAAVTGLVRPASAATAIRFVTDWKAQAEHGGFYQAVADGLQLQWMLEPDLDMAAIVSQLFDALLPPRAAPADHPEDEGANSGQLGRE